jgi:hypothetical protein
MIIGQCSIHHLLRTRKRVEMGGMVKRGVALTSMHGVADAKNRGPNAAITVHFVGAAF